MRNGLKAWRSSEIIAALSAEEEVVAECRRALPILKDEGLYQAAKTMAAVIEQLDKNVRTFRKELDRRKAETSEPSLKNLANAFKV